jgi:hypothetical protein
MGKRVSMQFATRPGDITCILQYSVTVPLLLFGE